MRQVPFVRYLSRTAPIRLSGARHEAQRTVAVAGSLLLGQHQHQQRAISLGAAAAARRSTRDAACEGAAKRGLASSASQPRSPSEVHRDRCSIDHMREKRGYIIDMDGVVYHGSELIDGAKEAVEWMQANGKAFMFLTNSSERSPRDLSRRLSAMGIQASEEHFHTSAIATAEFVHSQVPHGSAYVIGEPGLMNALHQIGYSHNDINPDFVIVGETRNYNYEKLERAVHLLARGARLVGTNCDVSDRGGRLDRTLVPACGALCKPIELASGKQAFYVGKPSPLMFTTALEHLELSRDEVVIVGDRMDTDILGGTQSGIDSILVLSGVTSRSDLLNYAYSPDIVVDRMGDLVPAPRPGG